MRRPHVIVGTLSLCALVAAGTDRAGAADRPLPIDEERPSAAAPVDHGLGPGVPPTRFNQALQGLKSTFAAAAALVGGSDAHLKGAFGAPITWPIVGIHAALLPDGRVLSFGTNERGQQGAQMVYDIWDPARGTGRDAHLVLPNTTATNIFCSGQTLLATTGEVVMTGGTVPPAHGEDYGSLDRLTVFRPKANAMAAGKPMAYRRWYPPAVPLPNGEVMVVGGREEVGDPATTPEVLTRAGTWRALPGATSDAAFGAGVPPTGRSPTTTRAPSRPRAATSSCSATTARSSA